MAASSCYIAIRTSFALLFFLFFSIKPTAAAVRCASTDKTPYTAPTGPNYANNTVQKAPQPQKLSADYEAYSDDSSPYQDRRTYQNRTNPYRSDNNYNNRTNPYRNDYNANYYNRSSYSNNNNPSYYDRSNNNDNNNYEYGRMTNRSYDRGDPYDRYSEDDYSTRDEYKRPNPYYNATGTGYYQRNFTATRISHNDTGYNWTMGYDGNGINYRRKAQEYGRGSYDDYRYPDNYESGRMTGDRYRDDDYGRDKDYDAPYRGPRNSSGPYNRYDRGDEDRDRGYDNNGRYDNGRKLNDSYSLGRHSSGRDDRYDDRDRYSGSRGRDYDSNGRYENGRNMNNSYSLGRQSGGRDDDRYSGNRDRDYDNNGRYENGRILNDSYSLGRHSGGRDPDRYSGNDDRDRYGFDDPRSERMRGPDYDRYGKVNGYDGNYGGPNSGSAYGKPSDSYGAGYDCPIQTKETKSSHADIPTTSASAIVSLPTGDHVLYCSQHPAKTILAYPLYCSGYGEDGMGKEATPTIIENTCFDIRVVDDLNNLEKPNHLIITLTKGGHSAAYQVDYSSSTLKLLPCLHVFEYKYLTDFESVPLGQAGTLLAFANNNVEQGAAYHETVQPLYIAKDGKIAICGFADIQNAVDVTAWKKTTDSIILVYSQRRGNTRRTLLQLMEIRFKEGYCDVRPYKYQKTIGAAIYEGQRNTLCAYEPFTIDQCLCGVEDLQILRAPHYHKTVHLGVAVSNNVKFENEIGCPIEERLQPDNQFDKSFCCCPLATQRSFIIEYSQPSRTFDFLSEDDNAFQTLYAGPESATEISQLQTEKCCPVFQTISPVGETSLYTLEQNRNGGWQVYQFINHGLPSFAESSSFGYCDDNDVIVSYTLHSFQSDNTIYHIRCNHDGKYNNDFYMERGNYGSARPGYVAPAPYIAPPKQYTPAYNATTYRSPSPYTPAAYPTPNYAPPSSYPTPNYAPPSSYPAQYTPAALTSSTYYSSSAYSAPSPPTYNYSPYTSPSNYAPHASPSNYAPSIAAKYYTNATSPYNRTNTAANGTTYNTTYPAAAKPQYDARTNYSNPRPVSVYINTADKNSLFSGLAGNVAPGGAYRHGFGNDLYNGGYGNYSLSKMTYGGPQLYGGGYQQPVYNVYQPAPLNMDLSQYASGQHGIRFTNSTRGGGYFPPSAVNGGR